MAIIERHFSALAERTVRLEGISIVELHNFPGIVQRFDRELHFTVLHPVFEEFTEVEPVTVLDAGEGVEAFQDKLAEGLKNALREVFDTGQPKQVEYAVASPDGLTYRETSLAPELAPDGSVSAVLAISLDVTARRRVEEAYQTLIEHSLQELLILQDSRIVYANSAAIQNSCLGLEKLLNATVSDMLEYIHSEDREIFVRLLDTMANFSEPVRFTYRILTPQGRLRWMDVLISQIEYCGRPAFQVAQVDITEQKEAERCLQETLSDLQQVTTSISAALWTGEITPQGKTRTIYISPVIEKILCRPVAYFMADPLNSWTQVIHPDDRKFEEEMAEAACRGDMLFEREYRILLPDGEIRWVLDSVRIERLAEGKIILNGMVLDITKAKNAEEALYQANEQLRFSVTKLSERNHDAILINEMGELLQSCLDVEEVYEVVRTFGHKLLPDHSGALYILNDDGTHAEKVTAWGETPPVLPLFQSQMCWGLRRGRVHIYEKDLAMPQCGHIDEVNAPEVSICVPLIAQGETMGVLYSACLHARPFDRCYQLITTIAERAALAIANLRLQETLRMQAIRDPLTGLFNRRYMDESLAREMLRAQRRQYSFAVVMVDIDHFKVFNDQYGHQAGDVLLQALSACLVSNVRGEDIVCRYGGEEFVIILPEISLEKACNRMEEIRLAAKHLGVEYRGQSLGGITVSIGVAAFPQHGGETPSLLLAADRALYQAKQEGRDRVCGDAPLAPTFKLW
ncbi:MAG: diguanylate cyclase [Anaerolineaceae bacterium]|nr:diguanylate cyclase [Anaerolineaceae bacterium]